MKYSVIYADPPWEYDRKIGSGIAADHYPTLTIRELKNLPVREIAGQDCILFLWATFPQLKEAMELMESWGFQYKTCAFNWVKRETGSPTVFILGWAFGQGHAPKSAC